MTPPDDEKSPARGGSSEDLLDGEIRTDRTSPFATLPLKPSRRRLTDEDRPTVDAMTADLQAAALLMAELGAVIDEWPDADLGAHALNYAAQNWEVFPLSPVKTPMRGTHGHLEATTDPATIAACWARWPEASIGHRPSEGVVVLDIDPRHAGAIEWTRLEAEHDVPPTLQVWSGRGDGGNHRYFSHPGGKLRKMLAEGIDIKSHSGFVVLPPSIHAATGQPYRWAEPLLPIATLPSTLAALVRKPPPEPVARRPRIVSSADSPADWFTETRCWGDVLEPHGWHCITGNGDDDGSRWLHPTATSTTSATIKHACLFVYSTNTVFESTGAEEAHGYTRFRAWAMLEHHGNLSNAACEAVRLRGGT